MYTYAIFSILSFFKEQSFGWDFKSWTGINRLWYRLVKLTLSFSWQIPAYAISGFFVKKKKPHARQIELQRVLDFTFRRVQGNEIKGRYDTIDSNSRFWINANGCMYMIVYQSGISKLHCGRISVSFKFWP